MTFKKISFFILMVNLIGTSNAAQQEEDREGRELRTVCALFKDKIETDNGLYYDNDEERVKIEVDDLKFFFSRKPLAEEVSLSSRKDVLRVVLAYTDADIYDCLNFFQELDESLEWDMPKDDTDILNSSQEFDNKLKRKLFRRLGKNHIIKCVQNLKFNNKLKIKGAETYYDAMHVIGEQEKGKIDTDTMLDKLFVLFDVNPLLWWVEKPWDDMDEDGKLVAGIVDPTNPANGKELPKIRDDIKSNIESNEERDNRVRALKEKFRQNWEEVRQVALAGDENRIKSAVQLSHSFLRIWNDLNPETAQSWSSWFVKLISLGYLST